MNTNTFFFLEKFFHEKDEIYVLKFVFQNNSSEMYPNIVTAYKILLRAPVAVASADLKIFNHKIIMCDLAFPECD